MIGSLLITYDEYDGLGGDYIKVEKNGIIQKLIFNAINNVYTTKIEVGDIITITNYDFAPFFDSVFDLYRFDYTTDDINGNNGIKETTITENNTSNPYTFTVSVDNLSYDFYYELHHHALSEFQIWTEASEPILTQNDDYLNQQY